MFLSCGDALFDLFAQPRQNEATGMTLVGDVGGSPLNVANGLARLGQQSGFLSKLSKDLFGQRLQDYLRANNIDFSLSPVSDLNTTLAIVETADDGSARYVFYNRDTADISLETTELPVSLASNIRVVHFASYSTVISPTADALLTLAKRESASRIISYDPNLRPTVEPDIDKWREAFGQLAATANIIKASDEDIETLLGKNKEEQFVSSCLQRGAELVFITRGPNGASGFNQNGNTAHAPGIAVDVADTVGAGDTFQAALLSWLANHGHLAAGATLSNEVDLQACMKYAISAAAITCTRSGADLPYARELES